MRPAGRNGYCHADEEKVRCVLKSRARRVCGDAFVSAGVLASVLGVLMSIDVRVREQVQSAVASASPRTVVDAGTQWRELTSALFDAAQTQSLEHAPLLIFVVVATVLLLVMART